MGWRGDDVLSGVRATIDRHFGPNQTLRVIGKYIDVTGSAAGI